MSELQIHPLAEAELAAAARFYQRRVTGLGEAFLERRVLQEVFFTQPPFSNHEVALGLDSLNLRSRTQHGNQEKSKKDVRLCRTSAATGRPTIDRTRKQQFREI